MCTVVLLYYVFQHCLTEKMFVCSDWNETLPSWMVKVSKLRTMYECFMWSILKKMCTHYKIRLKNPLARKMTCNTNMGIDYIHQKALIWFSIFQMIHTQYVYFPEIYLSMVACNFSPHRLALLWYALHILILHYFPSLTE